MIASRRIFWAAVTVGLLAISAWIYWPGSDGPALLDDYNNVLIIPDLREAPELAPDYILGNRSGPLGRPVSIATFVLENMLADGGIRLSKQVNIFIHLLNGLLVAWLMLVLLRFAQLPVPVALAGLLAACWLLAPMFVSTVLYTVQRMAMLCASFSLASMLAFAYWRIGLIAGRANHLLLPVALLFFVVGLYSKENAAVVLPILLLMELLWFECRGPGNRVSLPARRRLLLAAGSGGLLCLVALVLAWPDLQARFAGRSFSLEERLLTQGRILWDYVGQFFWPDVQRLGLYHDDYPISASLIAPQATLAAAVGWLLTLGAGAVLCQWRHGRYIFFGLLWFLVAHSVESTVLPLELYYEHRNYFPAIGLLLSIGVGLGLLIGRLPAIRGPVFAWLGCLLLVAATVSSSQVQIWSNRTLLTMQHVIGHPGSSRANIDMAELLASAGDIDGARHYSSRAFSTSLQEREGDALLRDISLACLAGEPVTAAMIAQLGTRNPERPISAVTTLHTLVKMIRDGVCESSMDAVVFADRMVEIYLVPGRPRLGASNVYLGLAILENALQRYGNAFEYIDRFLVLDPGDHRGLLMKLHFATALGKVVQSEAIIQLLLSIDAQGRLSVEDRQTLDLYLGDED
jgi:protein O-mannosyl-transferase